jgi:hypothetical protein
MTEDEILAAVDSANLKETVSERMSDYESELEQSAFLNRVMTALESLSKRRVIHPFKTVGGPSLARFPASWDDIQRRK